MKKAKLEQRFYEAIGIKRFRKIVRDFTSNKKPGEASNYYLPKDPTVADIKKFVGKLKYNAKVHGISGLLIVKFWAVDSLLSTPNTMITLLAALGVLINAYLVILQRHHYLRLKPVLERKEKAKSSKQAAELTI